jgi:hypothetical protein
LGRENADPKVGLIGLRFMVVEDLMKLERTVSRGQDGALTISRRASMHYLSGVLTGILLTILVVFIVDNFGDHPDSQDIVRWDLLVTKISAGTEKAGEEVRESVHEATEPEPAPIPAPPAATIPPANSTPPPVTTDIPEVQ